ncbi:MAG: SDR family oxidoreductase [Hydrogenophaga sp.]|uniref:UDP-glucose 4-epimerase family protein n=1 Tax=Hydrogenophaga sp. TaxID=1904254 RepID=UPI001E198026|nr:SDR family oxidoreductase [Hydrogenophaga sp.]MBX3611678.1 SDR family oxidoreductase [Hydrogenophaga sp.]
MKVLVTGGSGMVGSALASALTSRQTLTVVSASRRSGRVRNTHTAPMAELACRADHGALLSGIDTLYHLAARVHIMDDPAADPLTAFREVNTAGTLNLAHQAAAAGVRRFVFVSSIKVNGEATEPGHPFHHDDPPAPQDPYGISKREGEDGLREIAAATGMEVVIVRPPLVYGPGVKANFAAMMRAVQRGLPLPLGAVTHNRRSLVALDNLVDLLITCIDHPAAANQTFLVSDGEDLSTAGLLRRLGQAMGKPARLLPAPPSLLQLGATMVGKRDMAQRLLGNLQVDIDHTRQTLDWTPPISVDEGLRRAAAGLTAR